LRKLPVEVVECQQPYWLPLAVFAAALPVDRPLGTTAALGVIVVLMVVLTLAASNRREGWVPSAESLGCRGGLLAGFGAARRGKQGSTAEPRR
jgi:hypothetical protein